MNELKVVKNDKDIVLTAAQMKRDLEEKRIQSVGFLHSKLNLEDHEVYFKENYLCRFNEVSVEYETARFYDGMDGDEGVVEWEVLNENELLNDFNRAGVRGGKTNETHLGRMLGDRRLVPSYDPLKMYFLQVSNYLSEDDEGGYIDEFANYVKVEGGLEEQERWVINFKKALVRTVKCAINDNYFNKQCLTLHSTDQNLGKTSFLRTLCPPALKSYYYEGSIGSDKDSQTVLIQNFIILIDELANLTRVDINVLKAIMSKLSVQVRLPYAAKFTKAPRRASMFATTNRMDFLTDDQNVRWVIFSVESIDKSYGNIFTGEYNIDIDKIWAEAYRLYKSGYNCELSPKELGLNEENNSKYSAMSLEKEVIMRYFVEGSATDVGKKGYYRKQSGEIFEMVCQLLEADNNIYTVQKINQKYFFAELSKMWKKTSIRIDNKVVSGYHFLVKKEMDSSELF